MGGQTDFHSFCPPLGRTGLLTGRVAGITVAGVTFASLVGWSLSLGGLVENARCLLGWQTGVRVTGFRNRYRLGVDFPLVSSYSHEGSGVVYTPLGRGADPHYHIVRPK